MGNLTRRCPAIPVKDITFFPDSRQQIETERHCSGSPQEKFDPTWFSFSNCHILEKCLQICICEILPTIIGVCVAMALWFYGSMVLWWHVAMVQWCYGAVLQWYNVASTIDGAIVPCCYAAIMLLKGNGQQRRRQLSAALSIVYLWNGSSTSILRIAVTSYHCTTLYHCTTKLIVDPYLTPPSGFLPTDTPFLANMWREYFSFNIWAVFTSQNWNFKILMKNEQKLGLYF